MTTGALAVGLTLASAAVIALTGRWLLTIAFGPRYGSGATLLAVLALGAIPVALVATHATFEVSRHSPLSLLPWLGASGEVAAIAIWHGSPIQIALASYVGLGLGVVAVALAAWREAHRARLISAEPSGAATSDPTGRLRILLYNWRDLAHPASGGAEVYVHELARDWAAAGHAVTFFTAAVAGNPADESVDGIASCVAATASASTAPPAGSGRGKGTTGTTSSSTRSTRVPSAPRASPHPPRSSRSRSRSPLDY